jgi:hypothetical protein
MAGGSDNFEPGRRDLAHHRDDFEDLDWNGNRNVDQSNEKEHVDGPTPFPPVIYWNIQGLGGTEGRNPIASIKSRYLLKKSQEQEAGVIALTECKVDAVVTRMKMRNWHHVWDQYTTEWTAVNARGPRQLCGLTILLHRTRLAAFVTELKEVVPGRAILITATRRTDGRIFQFMCIHLRDLTPQQGEHLRQAMAACRELGSLVFLGDMNVRPSSAPPIKVLGDGALAALKIRGQTRSLTKRLRQVIVAPHPLGEEEEEAAQASQNDRVQDQRFTGLLDKLTRGMYELEAPASHLDKVTGAVSRLDRCFTSMPLGEILTCKPNWCKVTRHFTRIWRGCRTTRL